MEGRGQATATVGEVNYQEKHVSNSSKDPATAEGTSVTVAATKELENELTRLKNVFARLEENRLRLCKQRDLLLTLTDKMMARNPATAAVVESQQQISWSNPSSFVKKVLPVFPVSKKKSPVNTAM